MQIMTNAHAAPDPMKAVTGECRLTRVALAEPRANPGRPDAPPKYGVTLLIPKGDAATMQRIRAAIGAAVEDGVRRKWNNVRPANPPHPVWDGDGLRANGEPFGPECAGCWVLTAGTSARPGIVDADLREITDASALYSGMYGRASIRFFPYHTAGKKGVGASLCNVQKTRDGDPLPGRGTPEEDFGEAGKT